jgi:membrane dipeptidase
VSNTWLDRALELHAAHPVVEAHGDIPMDLWRRRRSGEEAPLRNDYLTRLRAGGVRIEFMTVGGDMPVTMDGEGRPELRALELIDDVLEEADGSPELQIVRTQGDLDQLLAAGRIGLVLHFEGCRPLRGQPMLARTYHRLGLRSAQLTWNLRNELADCVAEADVLGLTSAGREAVREFERLGVLIDVSHLAERCFWEVCDIARRPVVASHANAAAVWPHPRNLTDEQIRAVAATGGYVGVCFFPAFIGPEPTLERLLDHVDHLAQLVGCEHIAVGPDYVEYVLDLMHADMTAGDTRLNYGEDWQFPDGLRRVETLPVFTAGLLERGYGDRDAAKIVGGNALRVLREVLPQDGEGYSASDTKT